MHTVELLEEACELAAQLGYRTRHEWLGGTGGGACQFAGQKWIFRVQNSNGQAGAIRIEVNGGYQVGSTDIRDDQWHHVAAVLVDDGSPNVTEIALYLDGHVDTWYPSSVTSSVRWFLDIVSGFYRNN